MERFTYECIALGFEYRFYDCIGNISSKTFKYPLSIFASRVIQTYKEGRIITEHAPIDRNSSLITMQINSIPRDAED